MKAVLGGEYDSDWRQLEIKIGDTRQKSLREGDSGWGKRKMNAATNTMIEWMRE